MTNYGEAIREGFAYLLRGYPEVFAIGQGLWAPWYVGNSMKDLDKEFGRDRIMDSPVSEVACTGAAVGASLCGFRPIVIHPRMDFMILAIDQIVNQAAKWSSMFGGRAKAPVTIRGIINRGGEQGAQHSQALHSWFSHIPGLRVVMPANPQDARDLLIASVLSDDPVLYLDDRWLYDEKAALPPVKELDLASVYPQVAREGSDVTLVAAGYSVALSLNAAQDLALEGISCEVIDLRVLNPIHSELFLSSARKTGRVIAVDGGWKNCGLAGEILALIAEHIPPSDLKAPLRRITLPDAPAPTSKSLEAVYYPQRCDVVDKVRGLVSGGRGGGVNASSS